jgi:hypothetical protein
MEKKPEIDGKWLEVGGEEILPRLGEIEGSEIAVVTEARIEMAGKDRDRFVEKLKATVEACEPETAGMDDGQKSFYVLKKMLLS